MMLRCRESFFPLVWLITAVILLGIAVAAPPVAAAAAAAAAQPATADPTTPAGDTGDTEALPAAETDDPSAAEAPPADADAMGNDTTAPAPATDAPSSGGDADAVADAESAAAAAAVRAADEGRWSADGVAEPVVAPPSTAERFVVGLLPGLGESGRPDWLVGVGPLTTPEMGAWFFLITMILSLIVGIDWRNVFSLRNLDVLGLLAFFPFFFWRLGTREIAYAGVFGLAVYFFARLMLEGQRKERPAANYLPTGALVVLAVIALGWNGFVIAVKPVGTAGQDAVMAAEMLKFKGGLPYGNRQFGPGEQTGPFTYLGLLPFQIAAPATAPAPTGGTVRLVPFTASQRETIGIDADQAGRPFLSPREAVAAFATTPIDTHALEFPAFKIATGLAQVAILLGLTILGMQFHNLRAGLTLAVLYGINPYVLSVLNDSLVPIAVALVVFAIAARHRPVWSGIFLGLASAVALWPILLFPLFMGYFLKNGPTKTLLWVSLILIVGGFGTAITIDPQGAIPWDLIGFGAFIAGILAAVGILIRSGFADEPFGYFIIPYGTIGVVALASVLALTPTHLAADTPSTQTSPTVAPADTPAPTAATESAAPATGVFNPQLRLRQFIDATIRRQLQPTWQMLPEGWWVDRAWEVWHYKLELVLAVGVLAFMLSFVPDRPNSFSLVALTGAVCVAAQLWVNAPGGAHAPWWFAIAIPALLLPMSRRSRDSGPGWAIREPGNTIALNPNPESRVISALDAGVAGMPEFDGPPPPPPPPPPPDFRLAASPDTFAGPPELHGAFEDESSVETGEAVFTRDRNTREIVRYLSDEMDVVPGQSSTAAGEPPVLSEADVAETSDGAMMMGGRNPLKRSGQHQPPPPTPPPPSSSPRAVSGGRIAGPNDPTVHFLESDPDFQPPRPRPDQR